jgi:Holliday junction resolvase RusA-like endonuclease
LSLTITIPGEPFAQPRARAARRGRFVRLYDPPDAVAWKGTAQVHIANAMREAGMVAPAFPDGGVILEILAVFSCPKSDHRKRDPRPRRPKLGVRDDWDNIGKAVSDAANGLLWVDDGHVVRGSVVRIIGAQGEAPFVRVTVRAWNAIDESEIAREATT